MRRVIVLALVMLIIGLSLLTIQCSNPDTKSPFKGIGRAKTGFLKGLEGKTGWSTTEQFKMPPKGFR